MKSSYILKLVLLVLLLPAFVIGLDSKKLPPASQKETVKYAGLTGTLVNLLNTRTPQKFIAGACEISMEDLICKNIARQNNVLRYLHTRFGI